MKSSAWLAIVLIGAAIAHAQDDSRRWARETYARAEGAFERGEDQVALGLFRALVERTGNQSVRYNVAVCLERMGRAREAHAEFLEVSEIGALPPDVRAAALEAATRLRSQLGTLVLSGPAGARPRVDGTLGCELPCEAIVDPGTHRVELADRRVEIEVAAGERREIALTPAQPGDPIVPLSQPGPSLGWPTILGAILGAIGAAGVTAFGLIALDDHSRFARMPTLAIASEGSLMRDLANVSLAVLGTGALFFAIDLVLFATWSGPRAQIALGPLRLEL